MLPFQLHSTFTSNTLQSHKILMIKQGNTQGVSSIGKPCRPQQGFPLVNLPEPLILTGSSFPENVVDMGCIDTHKLEWFLTDLNNFVTRVYSACRECILPT